MRLPPGQACGRRAWEQTLARATSDGQTFVMPTCAMVKGGKETSQEFKAGKSVGRSEPEGCSSVTMDRNPPGVVGTAQSRAGSEDSAGTTPELGNPPCPETLGSITEIPGGFQGLSQSAGAGIRAGGARGSDGSSSADSLAAHVRNLLQKNPPPSEHPKGGTRGTGGFQSIPWGAAASRSTGAGMGESGSSSSGDSLAARVRSLLRSGSPGIMDTAQILRNAEEQERKIRAWVKLRLASQSQESLPEWDEEAQQRMAEIKAELLLRARRSAPTKDLWLCGLEASPEYLHNQEQDTEHFQAPRFPTTRHPQPTRTQELSEPSSGRAVASHSANLRDMQLKSWDAAPMPTCSQHPGADRAPFHALPELFPPLEWDTCAVGAGAPAEFLVPAPRVEQHVEGMAKEVPSVTSSCQCPRSPPGSEELGSSFSRGGFGGTIVPLEVDSASTGGQSHDRQPWESPRTCPSSPVLAGFVFLEGPDQDGSHPGPADGDRVEVYQDTDSLSAQDSGSVHAGKRQTHSAGKCDFLTQDVSELGRQRVRAGRNSQMINPFIEPPSLSSSQQEKSSSGHILFCESLEGPDPAEQKDLLQSHRKLGEEIKSPSDPPLIPKEVGKEQMEMSHHPPSGEVLSTTPGAPSSPTKRFLSCVHITLSSRINPSELSAENGMKSGHKPQIKAQPAPLKAPEDLREAAPKLPPAELVPEGQRSPFPVSSAGPSQVFCSVTSTAGQELVLQSRERPQVSAGGSGGFIPKGIPSSTIPGKPGKRTSDAATQITTESPQKTTFSAEICVHSQEAEGAAQKPPEVPNVTTSSQNKISPFPKQPAQPFLVPYKPSGSAGMYYVPYLKGGAQRSPAEAETSGESSGSNDAPAPPPRFQTHRLGLRDADPPGSAALQQKERISSKRARPKLAWAEEQRVPLGHPAGHRGHSKSVKSTHSTFKSTRFYLHHPMATGDSSDLSEGSSGMGNSFSWRKPHGHQWLLSVHPRKSGKKEFFPLTAEADESKNEDPDFGNETLGMKRRQQRREEEEQAAAGNSPLPGSQTMPRAGNAGKPPRQGIQSSGSLDELWVRFLERQRRHQHHGLRSTGELSLVERLDRLARVLQNPIKHTLVPAKAGEGNVPERKIKGREQAKVGLEGKIPPGSLAEPTAKCVGERAHSKSSLGELRENRSGKKMIHHMTEILEEQHCLETPSGNSSESRLSRDHGTTSTSSTSGWDTAMPPELETTTPSERSSSMSTIDTARLVQAFGHHRVRVSPRLSQLYSTISHQKSRLEEQNEGSANRAGAERPEGGTERHKRRKEQIQVCAQSTVTFSSDSTCASSTWWGPSPALGAKRRAWMLSKGIQAGDLEIVSSATKRNTRDVGVTFPTPRPNQDPWNRAHGTSWFVQGEDLQSESRKENHSNVSAGPGPSWFEPWTSTKPWREPLREKNWEEQQHNVAPPAAAPQRGAGKGPVQPFVKLTLQEALAAHRPDFLSRSRERVRRLRLLSEQRRGQRGQRAQREPPGTGRGHGSARDVPGDTAFPAGEKRRAIPKSEMVQRSKRIYEQLPEVRKKREEEKRRLEYNSYRLKAQLYKKKITNHVLGKKVPWS
ncbi:centrosome-associated protein ALMS1 isoform X2 [Pithys albifrons albifrons]|uniref:centrosome-associated protein ALMS1 isoform X2 n=1 Tax=Pithys albifrons albifrons TaxID=3385563 RepID=UPI003A5CF920